MSLPSRKQWLPGILAIVPDSLDLDDPTLQVLPPNGGSVRVRRLLVPKPLIRDEDDWEHDPENGFGPWYSPAAWSEGMTHRPSLFTRAVVGLLGGQGFVGWRGLYLYLVQLPESEWVSRVGEIVLSAQEAGEHFPPPHIVLVLSSEQPGYADVIATYLPGALVRFVPNPTPLRAAAVISSAMDELESALP